jgi:biopolymer transport protein ExbD
MAGQIQEPDDELISQINVTPLVDIFLVLLIIFMVTANLFIQEQQQLREIPLTLPTAASGQERGDKPQPLTIVLDKAGRLYLNGRGTSMEELGTAIDAAKGGGKQPDVVLSADRGLPYGQVTRVIDFVQLHGVGNFAINVEDQEIDGTP